MKSHVFLSTVAFCCLLGSARAESPDETLKALPAPVQKTIQAERQERSLVKIDKKEKDGQVRYKVVLIHNGMQKRLFVDGAGKLLRVKNDVEPGALPAPVKKAVDAQGKGGKFVRSTRINDSKDNKVSYEIEWDLGGRKKEAVIDPAGQVQKVEEVVAVASVPAAVRREVEKNVGTGKLLLIEAITPAGKPTLYEAQYEAGGRKSEIKVSADGKVLERE